MLAMEMIIWLMPAIRPNCSDGAKRGVDACMAGMWKAEPTERSPNRMKICHISAISNQKSMARIKVQKAMKLSASIITFFLFQRSMKTPLKGPSTACGNKAAVVAHANISADSVSMLIHKIMAKLQKEQVTYCWRDRKRTFLGLPLSFTVYRLTEEKLLVQTGFLNLKEEEVRLYRIMDLTLNRTFGQRIFRVGTIHCSTADKSTPEFDIKSVKNPDWVKETLSKLVEEERNKKRISGREFFGGEEDEDNNMG